MKKTLLFLAIIGLIFYVFSRFNINKGVVAFGDSLTYGTGSAQGGGYVKILSQELGVPITNLGVVGDTTLDALNRIEQVTSRKPKVTIVLLGGNDFLRHVPKTETRENLEKIIEKIQQSGSAIILVGLDDDIYKELAEKYKTAYVPDILHGVYGNPNLMSDNLHPNDAGYKIMAERIKPV